MSASLRRYLIESYECGQPSSEGLKTDPKFPIQIDDQDDNDNINEFCNIFCTVGKKNNFTIEITGLFPITQQMKDLAEIYKGSCTTEQGGNSLSLTLNIRQIEAIMDLADKIRKTSYMGETVNNPNWLSISARTISSLYRFVRIIKDFTQEESK